MSNEKVMRHLGRPVLHEGEDGLFRQSWYAVCRSQDVVAGKLIGRPFLDGRVVVWRGEDGVANVISAFCPHVGASLEVGAVVGSNLRCAFHHWEYSREGHCTKTGIGDPAPSTARLFSFPTVEKYGVVWAFNGETPLFELEMPSRPIETLRYDVAEPVRLATDPWVICCNTPDWAHFAMVHRFQFARDGQDATLSFGDFGVKRTFTATLNDGAGPRIDFNVTVSGVNLVLVEGVTDGRWFAVAASLGVPEPGACEFYATAFIDRSEWGDDAEATEGLAQYKAIASRMIAEDAPIWDTMRFKPGTLTVADRSLSKYLEILRAYPRAHPSAAFIR